MLESLLKDDIYIYIYVCVCVFFPDDIVKFLRIVFS